MKLTKSQLADLFIAINEGNPVCGILNPHGIPGFNQGLVALYEKPEMMKYIVDQSYDRIIETFITERSIDL